MKAILTLVISFCLLHIQVHTSYKSLSFGITSAYSQTTDDAKVIENEAKTTDDYLMMEVILLTVVVMMAPQLLLKCRSQWDIWLYGATALFYIAYETFNAFKYKKASDREMKITEDEEYDTQLVALESARDETKEAAEAAHIKARNSMIAGIGFLSAFIGLGITMLVKWSEAPGYETLKCDYEKPEEGTEISTTSEDIGLPDNAGETDLYNLDDFGTGSEGFDTFGNYNDYMMWAQFSTDKKVKEVYASNNENILNYKFTEKDSSSDTKQLINQFLHSGKDIICSEQDYIYKFFEKDEGYNATNSMKLREIALKDKLRQSKLSVYTNQQSLYKNYSDHLISIFFSKAHANSILQGLGFGAVAAILVQLASKMNWFSKMMNSAWSRLIAYAAMSTLAFVNQAKVKSAAETLDERVEQYEKLINRLKELINKKGFQIDTNAGYTMIERGPGPESSISEVEEISQTTSCFTGEAGQLKQDPNCLCKAANNCKQMELPKMEFNGMTTPGVLSEPMSMFQGSANSLYSGDVQGAEMSPASLGNFAVNSKKYARKINGNLNKKLKKLNKNQVPLEKKYGGLVAKMTKTLRDGINGLSPAEKQSLNELFGKEGENINPDTKSNNSNNLAISPSSKNSKSTMNNKKASKDGFMGFDFGGEESTDEVAIDPDSVAANMNDQGMFQGDIRDRPDEDIFKIINTRYLKSAYPIFFDEEGGAPPQNISE